MTTLLPSSELAELLSSEFQHQLKDNPEFASQSGMHEYDHLLQDLSPAAFDARLEHNMEVLQRARQIPSDKLSKQEKLHLRLFVDSVATETEAIRLSCHLYPINSIGYGGVVANFVETLEWQETGRPEKLVARIEAFPQQCNQYKDLLRRGMELGRVASKDMLRNFVAQTTKLAESGGGLKKLCGAIGDAELRKRAELAVAAFSVSCLDIVAFVKDVYSPKARVRCGCSGMSDGATVYALALKFHTTTGLSAEEIHEIGLKEVARIRARYDADVLRPLGFSGSFAAFVEACRADPTHAYAAKEDLLQGYRVLCDEISSLLPAFFAEFPRSPLEITPRDSPSAPAAYYLAGTPDGSRPGRFYVNVSNLSQRPKYEMVALALHEAIPGHHHQCALALENESVPDFLRYLEDRRYEFCPARRQLYSAYLEGWALYCEALGEEMGVYKTPMQVFGRLSMEMMRAVRLVVDTGIHHLGWEVEKAITYMMEATGMHHHECEAECYRYEAWPGQACAYKVGEVAIWRMRRNAEEALGEAFNLKRFHSTILAAGPMPLDALASEVDAWVATESSSSKV